MKERWRDEELPFADRLSALLGAATSRGTIKQLGRWLDGAEGEPFAVALREQIGDPDLTDGKRLLRRALDRAEAAQVLHSPIKRDEAFVCVVCGLEVPAHGRTARDHCPRCLCSLHVDVVPGDRAADCGGVLRPVSVTLRADEATLHHVCARCDARRRVKVLRDGDPPDDWAAVIRVSAGRPAWP